MSDTTEIIEIRRALTNAQSRLQRAWEQLDRWEPNGPDYRDTERKLRDDVLIASSDVELLQRELTRAVHGEFERADAILP